MSEKISTFALCLTTKYYHIMRLSKSKQYRVSSYTADKVFITSRFGEFSTLKQCRLTANRLAREQRQVMGFFSVYCVSDDEYAMYDFNGKRV